MICKPDEAKNYACCSFKQRCTGDECMAWKIHYVADLEHAYMGPGNFPAVPAPLVDSGYGYCGLTKS